MDFLFKNVSNADEIKKSITIHTNNYDKGDVIFFEGDACKCIAYVKYGFIKACNYYLDGNERIIRVLQAKDTIGESLLFSSNPVYKASFIAETRVTIEKIYIDDLLKLINNYEEINLNLIRKISNQLISINDHVKILSQKSVRAKLSLFLYIESVNQNALTFAICFNKTELAMFLNTERPTLSKEISKMQAEGIIANVGYNYTILKIGELEKCIF